MYSRSLGRGNVRAGRFGAGGRTFRPWPELCGKMPRRRACGTPAPPEPRITDPAPFFASRLLTCRMAGLVVALQMFCKEDIHMLQELFANKPFWAAALSWCAAQVLKVFIDWIVSGRLDIKRIWGDGGYPSAHSALVSALAASIGKSQGLASPLFALACAFAAIVMHDARGVRLETGKQARTINSILDILNASWETSLDTAQRLKEMVGHTPLQVFCGAVLGIFIGILF